MNEWAPLAGDHETLVIAWVTWSTVRLTGQQGSEKEEDIQYFYHCLLEISDQSVTHLSKRMV